MDTPYISIVSPVYYGENLVDELVRRIDSSLSKLGKSYEIILVEDGSPDRSWEAIQNVCASNSKVIGIKLTRNFGQHYAITAGLEEAKGEWVVVMDCDLQDQPEEIPALLNKTHEGYEIVYAQRILRHDGFFKKLGSQIFYKTFGFLTDTKQDATIANFGIYHRDAIKAVLSMNDYIRFFPTMVQWVGFRSAKLPVKHDSRSEGKTTYSLKRLFALGFQNVIAFSDKPLRLTIYFGMAIALMSFFMGMVYLYMYFIGRITVMGFASLIITISFLSGLIIFTLGVVGIYLGKSFEQTKGRPKFIVHKKING